MKRIVVLSVLVILSLGGAYYLTMYRGQADSAPAHVLLGGLEENASALTAVTIENAEGVVFSARREQNQWFATHLDSMLTFPVDMTALSDFVSELTQATVLEGKTAKASQYSRLGVEPVTQPGSQGTLITLASATQQWRVLLGNLASSGMGRYVREPSQQRSYLIDKPLALPVGNADWLTKQLITVSVNTLSEVIVDGQEPFTLFNNNENGEWQLFDVAASELAYPGILSQTLNDIVNVNYDDMRARMPEEVLGEPIQSITLSGNNQTLSLSVFAKQQDASGYLVSIAHEADGETPWTPEGIENWVFELTDFQARGLLTLRSDLIRAPEAE